VRIQAIVRELHDEKIDVIEWNPDPAQFIAKALSPARVTGVYLEEDSGGSKTATVVVPEDQLSLAIGRDGQNARLAAKLTSWRIDIKSLSEAAGDALHRAQTDAVFMEQNADLAEFLPQVEAVLAKKAEGRPITPEEYTVLGRFVDRVERGAQFRREAELDAQLEQRAALEATLPKGAFTIPLDELGLSPSLAIKISGEGYSTVGDLMLQLKVDPEKILAIAGVGPKAMDTIQETLNNFKFPEVAAKTEPVVAAQPEAEVEAEQAPVPESGAEEKPVELSEEDAGLLAQLEGGPAPEAPVQQPSVEEVFARTAEKLLGVKAVQAAKLANAEPALTDEEKKKKKGKKKKFRELEYDPEQDVTFVRRRNDEWEQE
jgi:N utilization substance protein A